MRKLKEFYVTDEQFLRLTNTHALAKYISLIDYRIRFDELPKTPYGELVGYMDNYLGNVFQSTTPAGVLFPASDNGISPSILKLTITDVAMFPGSIKRPDVFYRIRPSKMPEPPPEWVKFLSNGAACPNVIVEVAVNNESPTKLQQDCHRYFTESTSVRLWIGIKVWLAGKKFWVGWADRAAAGNRGNVHTQMTFPPIHHSTHTPVNIVYHIPLITVYGPGIMLPPNSPQTLNIDCEEIRRIIVEFI